MKLKKILGSFVLSAALSTCALATEETYLGANLGSGYAGFGGSISYGSSLESTYENLGWEADAYYMLGKEESFVGTTWNYYGYGANVYATYSYPIVKNIDVMFGIGVGYNELGYEVDSTILGTYDVSASTFIAYKAQVKYALSDKLKVTAGYNMYMSTIGVEVPFSF